MSSGGMNRDGMGGNVGAVQEQGMNGNEQEAALNTFEQDFGPSEFAKEAEQRQFGGQAELGRETLEAVPFAGVAPGMGASPAELGYGDANALATGVDGKILGTDLGPKVGDGDSLEPEIVERVKKVGEEIEQDPHQGLLDFSKLREEYMLKRWNRVLGERNDKGKVV